MSRYTISTTDCLQVFKPHAVFCKLHALIGMSKNRKYRRKYHLKKKILLHIFKIIYRYIQHITRYHSTKLSWEMIARLSFVGHYSCHVTRKTNYLFLPTKGNKKTWDVIHTANHGRRLSVLPLQCWIIFELRMGTKGLISIWNYHKWLS